MSRYKQNKFPTWAIVLILLFVVAMFAPQLSMLVPDASVQTTPGGGGGTTIPGDDNGTPDDGGNSGDVGAGDDGVEHVHKYTQTVMNDKTLKSAATCAAAAVYYKSCPCGAVGTATFINGSPLAHTYVDGACTACGYTLPDCTHEYTRTEKISGNIVKPSGHVCGSNVHYACSVCVECEEVVVVTQEYEYCTWYSNCDGDNICDVCGNTNGHDVTFTYTVDANGTHSRSFEKCAVCNIYFDAASTTECIYVNGSCVACDASCAHATTETVEGYAATCDTVGLTDGTKCVACGEVLIAQTTINALGHDMQSDTVLDPTCTTVGVARNAYCSRCSYVEYEEIPALGHDMIGYGAQAPTCETAGHLAYEACDRCDYTTYKEIPALGHDLIWVEERPATCTDYGTCAHEYCTRCDYSTVDMIPFLGHDEISHAAQAPTCTAIGWEAYVTCSRCDYTTYAEQPALGHNYTNGTCSRCGATDPDYITVDTFADNQPVLNADQTDFTWQGNWTLGDMDAEGNYREFNTVHQDVNNSTKWLIYTDNGVDPYPNQFWTTSAGYRLTGPEKMIGTDRNYHMVIVWTAPEDGVIKIGATDFGFGNTSTNFNLTLCVNGVQVWPAEGAFNVAYSGGDIKDKATFDAAFADFLLAVKQGDKVQFVCQRIDVGSNSAFVPVVEYVEPTEHIHEYETTGWDLVDSTYIRTDICSICNVIVTEDVTAVELVVEKTEFAWIVFYAAEGMTWQDVHDAHPDLFDIVEVTENGVTVKRLVVSKTEGEWDVGNNYVCLESDGSRVAPNDAVIIDEWYIAE